MEPEQIIKYYSRIKEFRNFLKGVEQRVSQNIAAKYELWGDQIFLPFEEYAKIVNKHIPLFDAHTLGIIFNSVVWHFCRSRYRFEDSIYKLITESASINIPIDIFLNLKEWVINIDLRKKGLTINGKPVTCSLMSLSNLSDVANKKGRPTIYITLGVDTADKKSAYTYLVPMVSENIKECLDQYHAEYEDSEYFGTTRIAHFQERLEVLKKIMNLYLYILCENSSIVNKNSANYSYDKVKKSKHIFSPRDIKTWIIKSSDKESRELDIFKTTTCMKPHIRRGHFHGYWVGPRNNPRDLVVKWIPPIYINASKIDKGEK